MCWTDIDNELIKCVQVNGTHGAKDHKEVRGRERERERL